MLKHLYNEVLEILNWPCLHTKIIIIATHNRKYGRILVVCWTKF